MTKLLMDNLSNEFDFIITFANTGLEHEKTLEFVDNCDRYFGFNTVWLEAEVNPIKGKGTGFKIVDFTSSSRNGEPLEAIMQKYGIYNVSAPHCTRESKLAPINSYIRSLGYRLKDIPTAIGIRNDETRRVRKDATEVNIIYPLVDMFPSDKQDVVDWWEDQPFKLGLEEHDGNCKGCFKKSFKKIFKQLDSDPTIIEWYVKNEEKYAKVVTKDGHPSSVFYRNHISASTLKEMWIEDRNESPTEVRVNMYENSGCSESCELYEAI